MNDIVIEIEHLSKLKKHEYHFYINAERGDIIVKLSYFGAFARKTRRHKYKVIDFWDSYDTRYNSLDEPKINPAIKQMVVERIRRSIKFE